jgi:mannose-6-phosphate isomerase-like protein (cupin superfamily)
MQDILTKIAYQDTTFYEVWQESEGIPVYRGYFLEDLLTLGLSPWQRMGARGAFINLTGAGRSCDGYLLEIDGGREVLPQKHLFEEVVLVLAGHGATKISNDSGASHVFEWQRGSLFAPPLNTRYQHFAHGKEPVRLFAVTNAPVMLNQFRNRAFVFNNPFDFSDRYSQDPGYFTEGREKPGRIFESNFVADVLGFRLKEWRERGAGGTNIRFELAENTLSAHVSEFPVGTYKKAHRHGPGAHVLILSGEGYSLFWQEGQDKKRIDWHKGSLLVPPELWFHQHFNIGAEPARYIALKPWGFKFLVDERFRTDEDVKSGGDQIEYADQDPEIHRLFVEACRLKGAPVRMNIGKK